MIKPSRGCVIRKVSIPVILMMLSGLLNLQCIMQHVYNSGEMGSKLTVPLAFPEPEPTRHLIKNSKEFDLKPLSS